MLQILTTDKRCGSELTIDFSSLEGENVSIPVMLTSLYTRQQFEDFSKSYEGINAYWKSLPLSAQEEIFDCYTNIDDLCRSTSLVDGVTYSNGQTQRVSSRRKAELHSQIKKLVALHPWERIKTFLGVSLPRVHTPTDIEETIPERYSNQPKAKTYVREEFHQLVIYLYYYKFFVPVLAMLAANLKSTSIAKDDKELFILKEVGSYDLFRVPEAQRLMDYVDSHFIAREHLFNRALNVNGLSEEDIPDLVKSRVFVKALAIAEPQGPTHVVTTVSKELQRKLQDVQLGFNNQNIRKKEPRSERTGDENNLTSIEGYRTKTTVSNLVKGSLNKYSKDFVQILKRWVKEEDLPKAVELTEEAIEHFRLREQTHYVNPVWEHLGIAVLDKAGVSTQINDHVYFEADLAQRAVVTTIMDYHGFTELAIMMSTTMSKRPPNQPAQAFSNQAGQVLDKSVIARILVHYPYYDPEPANKPRSGLNNYGLMVIDQTIKSFCNYIHEVNGPNWLINRTPDINKGEIYELPADIKTTIAEFVLLCLEFEPLVNEDRLIEQSIQLLKSRKL